jgi:glutathione S-transferase
MKLVIGNKNYSSWSLRPWLLMRHAGIPFEEQHLSFSDSQWRAKARAISPAGRVPVLIDADLVIWDSLAIAQHLDERFPERKLWPQQRAARAMARSVCAEMHAGFTQLRTWMPMNVTARLPGFGWNRDVQKDIERISRIFIDSRRDHGAGGPFLFGEFSIVDAFFSPVIWRFNTYQPALPGEIGAYMQTMLALPAMRQWYEDAAAENEFVDEDEPYRSAP